MFGPRGHSGHPETAGGRRGGAQQWARRFPLGSRALQHELAVVAVRPCEDCLGIQLGVARERGLEVLARIVAPARGSSRPPEDAPHRAGIPGERPLDQAIGVRGELVVQPLARLRVPELDGGFA